MMTCLLSLPPLLKNPFLQDSVNKQRNDYECFDNNRINSDKTQSEFSNRERCNDSNHVGTCIGTSISRGQDKNGTNNVYKSDVSGDQFNKKYKTRLGENESGTGMCHFNFQNSQTAEYNRADKLSDQSIKRDHGTKRKCETYEHMPDYILSKRISPFLNTPKQKKDDRKKILKISIKKIKQLSDPEIFLRRTVLVNNTMKRLQSELREDKLETRRRKPFNFYSVPQNSCFSDVYLSDDPFLSGVTEEITDDMTDTLINNGLHEKSNDNKKEITSEQSDTLCHDMEISGNCESINTRITLPLNCGDENH